MAIAVLACARIGAVHSVVFAGFSAQSLADRIEDSKCNMVICSDYNDRGAKHIGVKQIVDEALLLLGCQSVEKVFVYKNTRGDVQCNPFFGFLGQKTCCIWVRVGLVSGPVGSCG